MKPWYKSRDDAWFATLKLADGTRQQVRLCSGQDNEPEAWAQLARYKTGQLRQPTQLTVATAFDQFLDRAHGGTKPATFEHYRCFLQSFADSGVRAVHGRVTHRPA